MPSTKATDQLVIKYMVRARDHEPAIVLQWGHKKAQLSTPEAREHALGVLCAAEAAESDRCLFRAMHQGGMSRDAAEEFIQEVFSDRVLPPIEDEDTLRVESIYARDTDQPYLLMRWDTLSATLSLEAARNHALEVFSKAALAESDALTHRWLTDTLQADLPQAAVMLRDMRNFRDPQWMQSLHTIADESK